MDKNIDVAIIMGSDSDLPIMRESAKFLEDIGVSYEIKILSVHRCVDEAINYAKDLKNRNVKAIIAGAGGAAHLPGIFAAVNTCPVIGVPIHSKTLSGIDSLYSIVQMPSRNSCCNSSNKWSKKCCNFSMSNNRNFKYRSAK